MLDKIAAKLGELVKDQGMPYPVRYGPERMAQSALVTPHVTISRDYGGGDSIYTPEHGINPAVPFGHRQACVALIYAKSTKTGATTANHEAVADAMLDQVLVGLRRITVASQIEMELGSVRLVSFDEAEIPGSQRWPGVVYDVRFTVARAVADVTFAGEAADEVAAGTDYTAGAPTIDTSDSPSVPTGLPGATTRE